jgi:hypothetical protein
VPLGKTIVNAQGGYDHFRMISGVNLISPSNATCYSTLPKLNATVEAIIGKNIEILMTYSIDDGNKIRLPTSTSNIDPFVTTIAGTATLPRLSDGNHSITVCSELVGYDVTINGVYYNEYSRSECSLVYFTVASTLASPSPSITPSPSPSPSPTLSPTPTLQIAIFPGPFGSFWITSPSNETYSSNSSLSLDVKGVVIMGSNLELFLKYSLDGQANLTLPATVASQPGSMFTESFDATASLPQLLMGSHNMTVFGDFEIWDTALENGPHLAQTTVYFTVNSPLPSLAPSTSPTQQPTPSPSPTQASEPTSTPKQQTGFLRTSLPLEYGYAMVVVLVIMVVAVLSLACFKKLRKQV